MGPVDHEVNRNLAFLRRKIQERGFTQLEVQAALGWGRSYVSQLVTKQKSLRFDQVFLILDVIGIDPASYFGELYAALPDHGGERRYKPGVGGEQAGHRFEGIRFEETRFEESQFEDTRALLRGLVEVLLKKDIVTIEDLAVAAQAAEQDFSS